MTSPAVELEHATLRIGGRTVLRDVSLAVRPGEFIGVLGPNGSGKTTLMRAVLGLCPPAAGTVRVFGHAPRRGDAAIGYLPQTRTVIPDLRMRGLDFIGSSLDGHRWGLPRHDAALVRRLLGGGGALRAEERRDDERTSREEEHQHDHDEDRQVHVHDRAPLPHAQSAL